MAENPALADLGLCFITESSAKIKNFLHSSQQEI